MEFSFETMTTVRLDVFYKNQNLGYIPDSEMYKNTYCESDLVPKDIIEKLFMNTSNHPIDRDEGTYCSHLTSYHSYPNNLNDLQHSYQGF